LLDPSCAVDDDPPAEIPETMTNMINGAKDILTGHKTNKAKPLLIIARIKAFTGPM
jgi:hypothetical protein